MNFDAPTAVLDNQLTRNHFLDRYNRRLALEAIQGGSNAQKRLFLDSGCGMGYLLEDAIKEFSFNVDFIGADVNWEEVAACRQRMSRVKLMQIDLQGLPFKDNVFDFVTCLNTLEHIDEDQLVLQGLLRILKPGGEIFLSVPCGVQLFDSYDEALGHVRRYELAALTDRLRKIGFNVVRNNHFGFFMYPGFYLVKQMNRLFCRKLAFEEKRKQMLRQAAFSGRLSFMRYVCSLEYLLGKFLYYPVGVRGYIHARKP